MVDRPESRRRGASSPARGSARTGLFTPGVMGAAMQRIIGTGPHRQFRRIVAAKNNSPSATKIRDDGRIFLGNRVGQSRQTVAGSAAYQIDVDLDRNRQAMQRPLPIAGCRALVQLSRPSATIIATIFIPLSFLTGLFGMNFNKSLPGMDDTNSFAWFIGGCVAVVVIMLSVFRWRRWI